MSSASAYAPAAAPSGKINRLALLSASLLLLAGCRLPAYNVSPLVAPPGEWQATAEATTPLPVVLMAGGVEVRRGLWDGVDLGAQAGWAYLEDEQWQGIGIRDAEDTEADRTRFEEGSHLNLGMDAKRALDAHGHVQITAQGGFNVLIPDGRQGGSPGFSVMAGLLNGGKYFSWGLRAHAGRQKIAFYQLEVPVMARFRFFRTPLWIHAGLVPSFFYAKGTDNFPWPWQQVGLEWNFGSPAGPRVLSR